MFRTEKNRRHWNQQSDAYQAEHGTTLGEKALAWGVWRIPESDLGVLGAVEGRDVLELGCGAAQWTEALSQLGARAMGIDLSEQQLASARARFKAARLPIPLVHGNAEYLPFRNESFDVVYCDHGAMTFAHPEPTVAEAARVLRPNGIFAFCMSSPLRDICWKSDVEQVTPELVGNYFELSVLEDSESVCYQLPYGAWIRLFRQHALVVEDLVELRASEHDTTTYSSFVPLAWATQWPAEHIWKLRKAAA